MRRAVAIAILISLLGAARADIYRSVDAQGHVQYSDTPSPGAELVYSGEVRPTSNSSSSSSSQSNRIPSLAERSEQISGDLAQQAAARAVEKDTAEVRSKQCEQARQMYQAAIDARRLYKNGEDGERQFLSDDEADQQRIKYRLAMDSACEASDQSSGGAQSGDGTARPSNNNSATPSP
jgi:hypothetical protein